MKKIGFNAFITATALAVGICSFASMPGGRALSERERIVSRGLMLDCRGCEEKGQGCKDKQPAPTSPGHEGDAVLICKGTPKLNRYSVWSDTQALDFVSAGPIACFGTIYTYVNGRWIAQPEGSTTDCGTYTECNDHYVSENADEYKKHCDNTKPTE